MKAAAMPLPLSRALIERIRSRGDQPFLTVRTDNTRAIEIYRRLGFKERTLLYSRTIRRAQIRSKICLPLKCRIVIRGVRRNHMRIRTFAALFTTALILSSPASHLSASAIQSPHHPQLAAGQTAQTAPQRPPRPRLRNQKIPPKSLALLSASGKRKALLPADRKPPPAWNAAGRRKALIWSATNWSIWAANIASSRCTRMTARPATTHTSRLPIPAQSRRTGGITIKGNLWTYEFQLYRQWQDHDDPHHQ